MASAEKRSNNGCYDCKRREQSYSGMVPRRWGSGFQPGDDPGDRVPVKPTQTDRVPETQIPERGDSVIDQVPAPKEQPPRKLSGKRTA